MPAEDSNTFNCTHFAIQRILYDLLQYSPSRIVLFGVDFFLGADLYDRNYSRDLDDWYRRNSMQPTISMSVHDYQWDFDYTDRLRRLGLIDTSSHVASLLSLGRDRYLNDLQRRMVDSGRTGSTAADAHEATDTMSRP
jgi:hypothetical protein